MRQSAVIAGASSGIGLATARHLLRAGWQVAVIARRPQPLERLRRAYPGRVLAVTADLSREDELRRAAAGIRRHFPRLDALVTSAGDFLVAPIARTSAAEFERIWRITVLAKFLLVRELLPALTTASRRRPPRAVVHVASLAAHRDFAAESAYASAMHAVVGLARSQDVELRPRGLRVAVVSPGLVRTPLTDRGGFPAGALRRALPPADIAASIAFLIDTIRAGGYIGEILHLAGALD